LKMNNQEKTGKGTLYIVATPIGNLEDITFRAARILKEIDIVAAEDTRHSRKLLSHLGISKPLTSYFDHNKETKGSFIIQKLEKGLSVALISDAGTPCISDPGYQLVRDALAAGIRVIPIPGPSAFLAALSVSGMQTDSFAFDGFLPSRQGKRRAKLNELKDEHRLLIFYESPNRLLASLADMLEVFGDRNVTVAREISKVHEEFLRGALSEIITDLNLREIKGEVLVIVSPGVRNDEPEENSFRELLKNYLMAQEISLKDAVQRVAVETGVKRSKVYAEALRIIKK
jgi:16S rRNA (cytidine1402-2'-O)-methyltransferase